MKYFLLVGFLVGLYFVSIGASTDECRVKYHNGSSEGYNRDRVDKNNCVVKKEECENATPFPVQNSKDAYAMF